MEAATSDVVVIGSGITGLAHAYEAHRRGSNVIVIEQDPRPRGASMQGSGYVGVTALSDLSREHARVSRETWLDLARRTDVSVQSVGSIVCARSDAEADVVREFAQQRGHDLVKELSLGDVAARTGVTVPGLRSAVHLPDDLAIDPRQALPALCSWLADEGVRFAWGTHVRSVDGACGSPAVERSVRATPPGQVTVETSRGEITAGAVVHCAGHDAGRIFPDPAYHAATHPCRSRLTQFRPTRADTASSLFRTQRPTLLSGSSMLGSGGMSALASTDVVFEDFAEQRPELLDLRVNLAIVLRDDGTVVVGSTHRADAGAFDDSEASITDRLREETERLLDTPLTLIRSWSQLHVGSDVSDYQVIRPAPNVRIVTITADLGPAIAFGLARTVLDELR